MSQGDVVDVLETENKSIPAIDISNKIGTCTRLNTNRAIKQLAKAQLIGYDTILRTRVFYLNQSA